MTDFTLKVDSIDCKSTKNSEIKIEFTASDDDVLEHIEIESAIDFYGSYDLLEKIGEENAKKYFGLVEVE